MDVVVEDCDCALFPKLEACVWCDVITLEIIVGSYCCVVVLTRRRASDVIPVTGDINGLAKVYADSRVIREDARLSDGSVPVTHGPSSVTGAVRRGLAPLV